MTLNFALKLAITSGTLTLFGTERLCGEVDQILENLRVNEMASPLTIYKQPDHLSRIYEEDI